MKFWTCSACGWDATPETIDLALWPEAGNTVAMICPECGAEGAFVDGPDADLLLSGESPGAH